MAAPSGPILDDHNRANVSPPGGAWANVRISAAGTNSFSVASNVLSGAFASAQGVLTAAYGPDWEWYCQITTLPATGNYVFLAGVYSDLSTSTWDGYGVIAIRGTNWTWQLRRYTNGASTQLTPNITSGFNVAVNDWIGVVRTGTALEAWHKPSAGSWTQVMTRTDATYTTGSASVRFGAELGDTTVRIDNIGGGTISSDTPLINPMKMIL